jgi:hypothetical protein
MRTSMIYTVFWYGQGITLRQHFKALKWEKVVIHGRRHLIGGVIRTSQICILFERHAMPLLSMYICYNLDQYQGENLQIRTTFSTHDQQIMSALIHTAHLIPFKKFLSLIFALLSSLIAFVSSSLFSTASSAPFTLPSSFAGKSIVCCCSGTLGAKASVSPKARSRASSFRCRFAATRRCFLDFAAVGES